MRCMLSSSEGPSPAAPLPPDPLLTRLLDGRYRLEALIGRGGMGSVYRALDTRLDRPVAVKVLREAADGAEVRFAAEVKTLARFAHPTWNCPVSTDRLIMPLEFPCGSSSCCASRTRPG